MKPITVTQLYDLCKEQIREGNGHKVIMISDDDEGNGYHYLWYPFTSMEVMEEPVVIGKQVIEFPFEFVDEQIAKKEDTIILG